MVPLLSAVGSYQDVEVLGRDRIPRCVGIKIPTAVSRLMFTET